MAKLDSQGWIDFWGGPNGKTLCAFFVRDEMLWVRRDGKYNCTQVGGSNTISGARRLARIISCEPDHWTAEKDLAVRPPNE
jgi:hypothetical protein